MAVGRLRLGRGPSGRLPGARPALPPRRPPASVAGRRRGMTLARPLPRPARRRMPWAVLIGVAVIAAVFGYLAFSEVGKALVYYLTPTELLAKGQAAYQETVRLGGLVKPGTKHGPDTNLSFTLT